MIFAGPYLNQYPCYLPLTGWDALGTPISLADEFLYTGDMWKLPDQRFARRHLLKVGLLGTHSLALSNVLRARSHAGEKKHAKNTSVVWLWLQGGAPHIETFDPKMDATSDYRSMVGSLSTSIPGVEWGGQLPKLSALADQMSVVRSFHHTNPDHLGASHYVLTAMDAPIGASRQLSPSYGSIAAKVRGPSHPATGVPTFVRVSRTVSFDFDQPLWLGVEHAPFDASGPAHSNLSLSLDAGRLNDRQRLRKQLDTLQRTVDQTGVMDGMDAFEQQAIDLVLSRSKEAFDISQEEASLQTRYGPGLGAQLLAARRLCEAGCGFVMLNYGWAPTPSQTPFAWDMHLGPSQPKAPSMKSQLEAIFPMFDHAIATFLEDIRDRGQQENILLVVTGDFGRTPKINTYGGRDHWPGLCTLALAGGGLRHGQVVGTSSAKAEYPLSNPYEPKDLMATLFHVLGIDPRLQSRDFAGRPNYYLPTGARPITELI